MAIEEISSVPLSRPESVQAEPVPADPAVDAIASLEGLGGQVLLLHDDHVSIEGSDDNWPGWALAMLSEIAAVRVASRRRDRGALMWGTVGAIAAVGVWQVASNDAVSLIGGLVVGVIAVILLGEFFLKPPDLRLDIIVGLDTLSTGIKRSQAQEAREFATAILNARAAEGAPTVTKTPAWHTESPSFPPRHPTP